MNIAYPWFLPPFVTLNIEFVSSNSKDDIGHTYKLANKLLPEKADKLWRVNTFNHPFNIVKYLVREISFSG